MLEACVLLKVVPTRTSPVLEKLTEMNGVEKAYITYGRFDIVCFLKLAEYGEIRKVTAKINAIDGVRSTETLVRA